MLFRPCKVIPYIFKTEFAVSANMAYVEVKLEPRALGGGEGGVYEDPENMVSSGGGNDRQTERCRD